MKEKRSSWCVVAAMLTVGMFTSSAFASCYAVVVGKDASSDGAVLLGHNEQNGGQRFLNFRKVPRISYEAGATVLLRGGARIAQVKETYAFLWSQNPGCSYSDGYLNEWGVAIVSDACGCREDSLQKLRARGQVIKGGVSYLLRRLVIERARTAREGVQVAGQVLHQVGYPSGRTLVIADPNEAWLLAMVRGKHWIAQRVPDDEVVLLPNVYITYEVDLKDKANFLGSPDLIEYAVKRGWYDPSTGKPFRFCEAYAGPRKRRMDPRQWRGQCLVTGKEIKREPDRPLPFSVKPARKLSVKDVISILRYHGSGGLCSPSTQEAAVFQLRSNSPPDIGCVYWRTSAEPCTSVLAPWYAGITKTPEEYYRPVHLKQALTVEHHFSKSPERFKPDETKAWWVFKKLQDLVNRDREGRIKTVRNVWDEFEAKLFAEQRDIEKRALELWQKDKPSARAYLTDYCGNTALQAARKARDLIRQVEQK